MRERIRYRDPPKDESLEGLGFTQEEKDILMLLYAKNHAPIRRSHLPYMLEYLAYLRKEREGANTRDT